MKKTTLTLYTIATMITATQLNAKVASEKICFESVAATPHETVRSEPVQIKGLITPAKVKVLGRGTYILNGEEVKEKESYVSNGDWVQVVVRADKQENANIRTALVIDDLYDVFTVTTKRHTLPNRENISLKCISENLGTKGR